MFESWQTTLFQAMGWVLLFGILFQTLLAVFLSVRRVRLEMAQQALALDLVKKQVHLDAARFRLEWERTQLSWKGNRKFRVACIENEAPSIQSFYLVPHDGKPLPPFHPGQYLTFSLRLPGFAAPVTRCYSLSSSPLHLDNYRVTIKRIPPPDDQPEVPPGLVSSYFHDHLSEGDILDLRAPSGQFFLDINERWPVVLIGGGIGITPGFSMLQTLCIADPWREVWFFYGIRHHGEVIWEDQLKELAETQENLSLHLCYSQGIEESSSGRFHQHSGRVSVELFKQWLPSNNYLFYICGPSAMMTTLTEDLKTWGVPKAHIHFESFGPSSVKKKTAEVASASEVATVTFAHSDKTAQWTGAENSLLDLAEASGVAIDSGCRSGSCGACLTAIKSGEITYLDEPGQPPEKGSCLVCIAVPKTDLILDT